MGYEPQDENEPFGHIAGYPIDTALLVAIVHAVTLVGCCLLSGLGAMAFLQKLPFESTAFLQHLELWRAVSYAFFHLPGDGWAILWFAFELAMLVWTGREVERFMGRRFFLMLYGVLLLATPVTLSVVSWLWGKPFVFIEGSWVIHVSFLVAFAVIYPNTILMWIPAKWLTALILGAHTLASIAGHRFSLLIALWVSAPIAYIAVRRAGVGDGLDMMAAIRERFARRAPEPSRPRTKALSRTEPEPDSAMDSVDSVLEKISKHGIGSLTSSERATLERARVTLLNRGKKDS